MRKEYPLMKKFKPIGLIKLENKDVLKDLRDGLLHIPAWFIIEVTWVRDLNEEIWANILAVWEVKADLIAWFDFIVCDDDIKNLENYLKWGVVPIIHKNNHLHTILKDFNPIKNDGNAFLYDAYNKWSIFTAIVRYMENYKFPFDNKNLVENVLSI